MFCPSMASSAQSVKVGSIECRGRATTGQGRNLLQRLCADVARHCADSVPGVEGDGRSKQDNAAN
jgi:uncharacterized glyoxalase superfamily metalloenzyme YdcJ